MTLTEMKTTGTSYIVTIIKFPEGCYYFFNGYKYWTNLDNEKNLNSAL